MADVKVNINYNLIGNKINKGVQKAQLWLDNEIVKDSEPFVPFLSGDLNKSPYKVGSVKGDGKIIYNEPYAAKMYYGEDFNFTKTFHSLAGPYWFEKAKVINEQRWIDGVNKIVKGEV